MWSVWPQYRWSGYWAGESRCFTLENLLCWIYCVECAVWNLRCRICMVPRVAQQSKKQKSICLIHQITPRTLWSETVCFELSDSRTQWLSVALRFCRAFAWKMWAICKVFVRMHTSTPNIKALELEGNLQTLKRLSANWDQKFSQPGRATLGHPSSSFPDKRCEHQTIVRLSWAIPGLFSPAVRVHSSKVD